MRIRGPRDFRFRRARSSREALEKTRETAAAIVAAAEAAGGSWCGLDLCCLVLDADLDCAPRRGSLLGAEVDSPGGEATRAQSQPAGQGRVANHDRHPVLAFGSGVLGAPQTGKLS